MNVAAMCANTLWGLSCLPAWQRFRRALKNPGEAQKKLLQKCIRQNADTQFGRSHRFSEILSIDDFRQRVPIRDYSEFEPSINQIRGGELNVLTHGPVRRLATTSGTTSARKLIPYTRGLQSELKRAIGPWMVDLFRTCPGLMAGRAYWSISPVLKSETESSAVPIGFEEDSEYLGGMRRRLIDAVMAVPASLARAASVDEWRSRTFEILAATPDLRLLSIWHPSFLPLLLEGQERSPKELWPKLKLISCWGDEYAAAPFEELRRAFPDVWIQPKGIIATEGIVSIPFAGQFPLAVCLHFLEFICDSGTVHDVDHLEVGQQYEMILTTLGGLYRYRLNDRIEVVGRLNACPCVRLIGKTNGISDRFGEKLSELFVSQVLQAFQRGQNEPWRFAMLAPDEDHYTLYVEGAVTKELPAGLDWALRANPHYSYCRELGQLTPPRLYEISLGGSATFTKRQMTLNQRLGDIKPVALSPQNGWSEWFQGHYFGNTVGV